METFTDSLELMMNMIAWLRLKEDKPDVIINPKVYEHTMIDNVDAMEMIKAGENAVKLKKSGFSNSFSFSKRIGRWVRASIPPGKILT